MPVRREKGPPGTVRQTPIQLFDSTHRVIRICSQLLPAQIAPANTRPACHHPTSSHLHSSVRYLENCQAPTTSASLNQRARYCHQVARVQEWEVACGGAGDDDDPPCVTAEDTVCDVEPADGTCPVVCSASLTFFMFGSASEAGRDSLSCASMTRALRATSEDMALMIRALHKFRVVTRRPLGHRCFTTNASKGVSISSQLN